jgi:uncharacterized membrane protein YedE/YeeE
MGWTSVNPDWLNGLVGGALIGGAAGALLLLNGRIAGISGIVGGLLKNPGAERSDWLERAAFVAGLIAAPMVFGALGGARDIVITQNAGLLVAGGLLVGIGTRMGSGCTSGHGICGLGRMSKRSIAAVATFMGVAVVVVAIRTLVFGGAS